MQCKTALLFILCTALNISTFSQGKVKVMTTHGHMVKGTLLENIPYEYLVVEVEDGKEIRVGYDSIYQINHKKSRLKKVDTLDHTGAFAKFEFAGILAKETKFDNVSLQPSFHISGGYAFKYKYRPALGIGVDKFRDIAFAPLYVSFDYDLLKGRRSPYMDGRIGYGFAWETRNSTYQEFVELKGGTYFSIGIGYRVQYRRSRLNLNVRYIYQRALLEVNDFGFAAREERSFRNLALGISYLFGH